EEGHEIQSEGDKDPEGDCARRLSVPQGAIIEEPEEEAPLDDADDSEAGQMEESGELHRANAVRKAEIAGEIVGRTEGGADQGSRQPDGEGSTLQHDADRGVAADR